MKLTPIEPPRTFKVGAAGIVLYDCLHIELAPGDVVAFEDGDGAFFTVEQQTWGMLIAESLNEDLPRASLRPVVAGSEPARRHLMFVRRGDEVRFETYSKDDGIKPVHWLDVVDAGSFGVAVRSDAEE